MNVEEGNARRAVRRVWGWDVPGSVAGAAGEPARPRPRGWVLASAAVPVAVLLAFPAVVPNAVGNLGSLLETFLPWGGLAVPVLLGLALLRRSVLATVSPVLPVAVWIAVFGGRALPADRGRRAT